MKQSWPLFELGTVHGHTASELVNLRVDTARPNVGHQLAWMLSMAMLRYRLLFK